MLCFESHAHRRIGHRSSKIQPRHLLQPRQPCCPSRCVSLSRIALSLCVYDPSQWHIHLLGVQVRCPAGVTPLECPVSLPFLQSVSMSLPSPLPFSISLSCPIRSDTPPCRVKETLLRDLHQNARPSQTRIPHIFKTYDAFIIDIPTRYGDNDMPAKVCFLLFILPSLVLPSPSFHSIHSF